MKKNHDSFSSSSEEFEQPEYEEQFKAPAKDEKNKRLFNKYKDPKAIDEQESQPEQQFQFVIRNLDTGQEASIKSIEQQIAFDKQNSFKRKQIKGLGRLKTWDTFWKNVYQNNELLRASAEKGDFQVVKVLVTKGRNGYPIEISSVGTDNWNALHFAAYENHIKIVNFLLENSQYIINTETKFKRTALHIATIRGHIETVSALCEHKPHFEHEDDDGNTALHFAAQNNYIEIIQLLLKHVAYMTKNKYGTSPYDACTQPATKQIFKKYGVKLIQRSPKLQSENVRQTAKMSRLTMNEMKENKIERIKLPTEAISPTSFNYYKILGKGSFGEVFLVQRKGEDKFYAMKVLSKEKIFGKDLVRYAMTERNVLSGMNHPFIVKLNYAFQDQTKLFLVMDYCPGGDLGKLLTKKKALKQAEARLYLAQIILAFEALHKNMIVFRDLKPDNVVLDSEGHARLTDFGLSKQGVYNNTTESFCGSIAYLAPQILNKQGHSRTVDWYLVGLLVYELLIGLPPYYNSKKQVLFENIKRGPLKIPKSMSQPAKDLIKKLLCRDPKRRLGSVRDADELKEHPFFQGIIWSDVLNRKLAVPPVEIPKINLNDIIKVNFTEKTAQKGKRIEDWTFVNDY